MAKLLQWETRLHESQHLKFPFLLHTMIVLMVSMIVNGAMAQDIISGTVTYRERILLRPGAVLEVFLEDVSRADASADILATTSLPDPGAPPYSFSLSYDPAIVSPNHSYNIRAHISQGGKLLFHTADAYPVLTRGGTNMVDMILQMTASSASLPLQKPTRTGAHGLALPGTFSGELPCADCEGIFYQLTLWPDQSYFLRRLWRGRDHVVDTLGRWYIEPDTNTLVLAGGTDQETRFSIGTNNDLRLLDRSGNDIVSDLNYQLVAGDLASLDASLNLRGMYSIADGRPVLVECLSQRMFPIAGDGAFGELPAADENSPVMISFDGHFEDRPVLGTRLGPTVVVDRFVNAWPNETCERNLVNADLVNTYWRILRLGDTTLETSANQREPNLLLRGDEPRYKATAGCNQISGGYLLDEADLSFQMGISTMMACIPPLDQYEQLLSQTLAETAGWKIDGQVMELFDSSGTSIALLQAVYLP